MGTSAHGREEGKIGAIGIDLGTTNSAGKARR